MLKLYIVLLCLIILSDGRSRQTFTGCSFDEDGQLSHILFIHSGTRADICVADWYILSVNLVKVEMILKISL